MDALTHCNERRNVIQRIHDFVGDLYQFGVLHSLYQICQCKIFHNNAAIGDLHSQNLANETMLKAQTTGAIDIGRSPCHTSSYGQICHDHGFVDGYNYIDA